MGGKVQEFSFPNTSAERLWQACIQSVGLLGYTVSHSDSGAKSVNFNTGRSMSSWAGQDLNATVISRGPDPRLNESHFLFIERVLRVELLVRLCA